MMLAGRRVQVQQQQLQRQSSAESESESCSATATTLPSKSKTHRRMPSFTFVMESVFPGSNDSLKSPTTNTTVTDTDMTEESWSPASTNSGGSDIPTDYWKETNTGYELFGGEVIKRSPPPQVLEIIRQLSFSPPRKMKKRADTVSSSSPSPSSDSTYEEDSTITIDGIDLHLKASSSSPSPSSESTYEEDGAITIEGIDLQHLMDLRAESPSPLLGLQYLPDDNMECD